MPDRPPDADHLAALQHALVALKTTRAKLQALEHAQHEPIAIIGLACRFPGGADTPEAFWRLLHAGVDAITPVPAARWGMQVYDPLGLEAQVKACVQWGSFLAQVDTFDPQFFGISPRE
ncbi:MAG TPA: beta-ketoacyl synthase N-terminal-like domain-containing protein, partial [Anaerolineae bacterium]|nr:beta-ketoacyl synthase N-terminal-like domain-containing protein [Anaerolineae bacterium]